MNSFQFIQPIFISMRSYYLQERIQGYSPASAKPSPWLVLLDLVPLIFFEFTMPPPTTQPLHSPFSLAFSPLPLPKHPLFNQVYLFFGCQLQLSQGSLLWAGSELLSYNTLFLSKASLIRNNGLINIYLISISIHCIQSSITTLAQYLAHTQ